LRDKYFRGNEESLRALCRRRVLFYNHGTRTLEFESELMRRVVADWLAEPRHKAGIELLKKLQEWQVACAAKVDADRQVELSAMASGAASKASMAAFDEAQQVAKALRALERDIASLREKLRVNV
jgi:hypothetical protein